MGTRPCGGDCFNDRGRYRLRRSTVLKAKEEEEEEEERLSWSYSSIQGRNCSDNQAETKLQRNRPMKEEGEEEENRLFLKKTRAFNCWTAKTKSFHCPISSIIANRSPRRNVEEDNVSNERRRRRRRMIFQTTRGFLGH